MMRSNSVGSTALSRTGPSFGWNSNAEYSPYSRPSSEARPLLRNSNSIEDCSPAEKAAPASIRINPILVFRSVKDPSHFVETPGAASAIHSWLSGCIRITSSYLGFGYTSGVQSLGATFVEVEGASDDTSAGGYAVLQSEEYLQKQRQLVQEKALKANIIIATAQVRGRKAPLLITEETINQMKPGSVIIDLAASTGGNCAYTENNKTIVKDGVTIIGNSDLSDELSGIASTLFSNNTINFLQILVKDGQLHLNEENEIIKSALISKAN